jgi:hydroxyacylglutathione hydrolase
MIVETDAEGPFFKNGFIVACERSREAVLIDPGDEVRRLLAFADRNALAITHILLTHAHIDHITGVAAAKTALGVPIWLHRDDLFFHERVDDQAAMFDLEKCDPLPPVDRYYAAGQVLRFGDSEVRVHHTPGHCPGGVCLAISAPGEALPRLFVGDTLFAGSIGRTDLEGGDYDTLIASIRNVLFAFPDDAPVYPGHGPSTTIGRERRSNPFVQ